MRSVTGPRLRLKLAVMLPLALLLPAAFGGNVNIINPAANSTNIGEVSIAASANEGGPFHLEVWDNGKKLGNVFSNAVNATYALSLGKHTTTILAVSPNGYVLDRSSVSYQIADSSGAGTSDSVSITSPTSGSTSISAVRITASANVSNSSHLEIWDNGYKLGNVPGGSVNDVYVLPNGPHVLTVEAVTNYGSVLSKSSVGYEIVENCTTSGSVQCNLDQLGIDNTQGDCDPREESAWVANPCGPGVQGEGGVDPRRTNIEHIAENGIIPDQGNLTLNGRSLHLLEIQESDPSNVLFRGQSPTTAPSLASNWTLDEYVYLPNPSAHQAFEMDAQYSIDGIWTKFYTECAFNMRSGTGYWGVFDSETGGWIFLNGQMQNGQIPPVVPCNRNQFAQPWQGSSNPSFSGWHHVIWSFLRKSDGTVTYKSLTFDGNTTQINFSPNSRNGGDVNDNGKFSALIQLDGVVNKSGQYDLVDAYVSEVNLTHTP